MTPYSEAVFRAIDRGLLSCASFLLPERQRAEWRMEWESELWHARRLHNTSGAVSWRTECELADFCFGAFRDAACLRRLWRQNQPRCVPIHCSTAQCTVCLICILLVSYLFSILSPGVSAECAFSRDQVKPGTVLIQEGGANGDDGPTMTIDQVRAWERGRQHYIDGFAFYRVARESVEFGTHNGGRWQIAEAASSLFTVAGWPLHYGVFDGESRSDVPRLVLSERTWRQKFGANPEVVGTVLLVGSRLARVAGIAPGDAERLPGNCDAWLLKPDSEFSPDGRGYVVAHLTRSGRSEMWGGIVNIASYDSQKSEHDYLGRSLEEQMPGPGNIYWFGVFLAFLALPAIASVSLTECSFSSHKPSRMRRAARLGFLGMKIILLMSITYFSSVDLAYWHSSASTPSGVYVQLVATFAIFLFGMRWALMDQRQRCPVCLKRVTNPAQVGLASRTFLAWSGTELICSDGHTLLHIPGLPTSWFSTQRWLYLDTSWDFLFVGSGVE
jgi:MacB-like periplasmic core domain